MAHKKHKSCRCASSTPALFCFESKVNFEMSSGYPCQFDSSLAAISSLLSYKESGIFYQTFRDYTPPCGSYSATSYHSGRGRFRAAWPTSYKSIQFLRTPKLGI